MGEVHCLGAHGSRGRGVGQLKARHPFRPIRPHNRHARAGCGGLLQYLLDPFPQFSGGIWRRYLGILRPRRSDVSVTRQDGPDGRQRAETGRRTAIGGTAQGGERGYPQRLGALNSESRGNRCCRSGALTDFRGKDSIWHASGAAFSSESKYRLERCFRNCCIAPGVRRWTGCAGCLGGRAAAGDHPDPARGPLAPGDKPGDGAVRLPTVARMGGRAGYPDAPRQHAYRHDGRLLPRAPD